MMGFHAFCFICLFFLFNPNLTQQLQKEKKTYTLFPMATFAQKDTGKHGEMEEFFCTLLVR